MSLSTKINLFFNYKKYGVDKFGNKYFIAKKEDRVLKKKKRMVWYNGDAEATKVPPVWHAWLHYMIDDVDNADLNYSWQKGYLPNLTGTDLAYRPPGHVSQGGVRDRVSSDIEEWEPNDN
ncbi:MAG: NADH-ubiquinone oxidoreductase subunit NDUFA12 family protein [Rickettsiales bacterium]